MTTSTAMTSSFSETDMSIFAAFFPPATDDYIDALLAQHQAMTMRITDIATSVHGERARAMQYFFEGNRSDNGRYPVSMVSHVFQLPGAIAALDAECWSKAMASSGILDLMPQARRDEWHKHITNRSCPSFTEANVRSTFDSLFAMRANFLAERVDGIFRGLSSSHVTNRPQGFRERMIIAGITDEHGFTSYSRCGLVNDLRCVVAKFMGRDEPSRYASSQLIERLKNRTGEWVDVDGNSLRIRIYKKGTAHLEIHPDMAWRLNVILNHLTPNAIPTEFRTRPAKAFKNVQILSQPLHFAVIEVLADMHQAYTYGSTERRQYIPNSLAFNYSAQDGDRKHALKQAEAVLEAIGGQKTNGHWCFDYSPKIIIDEIVANGCIPDVKSHQFYPTPDKLAEQAVALADIGPESRCLEPSAGLGALASLLPPHLTTCVEVAPLRAQILKAKGLNAISADFLVWSQNHPQKFDRVIMNPPFDRGQWSAHLDAALSTLKTGGRLVAILPATAKNQVCSDAGKTVEWHGPYAFPGTSIAVTILVAITH